MPNEEELFASKLPLPYGGSLSIRARNRGTEHCYAAGYPNAIKKQSCGVTRACPLLRATRKIPYSIKENNVTENRPLLHIVPCYTLDIDWHNIFH